MTRTPPIRIDHVRGDATGLAIPAHADAFREDGAAFLTQAFRAFGALGPDNAVARVVRIEPCPGGSTGSKLFLTVEYAQPGPALHTELFVKFSRDFTDVLRDHQRTEMESEARFAALSRQPGFPIATATAYFADYEAETGTGLVVTERVRFGEGRIEPHHGKCFDHEIDDPLPYYKALLTALARLCAAHKSGRLAPDIETRFPLRPEALGGDPIRYDAAKLAKVLDQAEAFAAEGPQLLPATVREPAFQARLRAEAFRVRTHEAEIQAWLRGDPDFIALCHWNAHIDNAWFWRDEAGQLHCGLIDWGRVGQITLGAALWGCLSAAHHAIWTEHLDTLLALFVREYRAGGGPDITAEALKQHLVLHVAAMGVARVLAFPEVIKFRVPGVFSAEGPLDPMILACDPARNCLHIYTVFLNLWRTGEVGARLDRLLASPR